MANNMYTLSSKLKLFSIILVVVGLIGIVYGFMNVPKTEDDVRQILSEQQTHATTQKGDDEVGFIDRVRDQKGYAEKALAESKDLGVEAHGATSYEAHALSQMQARPWSATLVAAFFFMMIALGVLVFYAIQQASEAGWAPALFRVMEGITAYLLPGSIIVLLIILFAGTNFYPWMDKEVMANDKMLSGNSGYLNLPFFAIRGIIYVLGWNLYRHFSKKYAGYQATADNFRWHKKNYNISVIFLAFFIVTECFMAIDWFMVMTPHWHSTMFPWYVFANLFVAGITALTLITIHLRSKGLLTFISDRHIHDLAKYIFAFSIFWTYIWFGQFMLIWYANIPEEVTYFVIRIQEYGLLFFGMLILNFVFPILILMSSDYKKVPWFVVVTGFVVLIGHYIDTFLLVMPSTVGHNWGFGIPEIAAICFFLGLFIYIVGMGLSKVSLDPGNNPFILESKNHQF